MKQKTIKIIILGVVIVGLVGGGFWFAKVKKENFIKSQTFDSINQFQENPSPETISKLKTFIESPLLDQYLRERAIFVLTDVSTKLEKNSETRDYLKGLALNKEAPGNLQSAALANINLIDELFPPEKHGIMNTEVLGEIKPGNQISIIVKLLSDIDVENVEIGVGEIKQYSPMMDGEQYKPSIILTPISKPAIWKGSIKANILNELKFDFQVEKEGEVKLPIIYKFNFDQIDYEMERQFLYFKITKTGGEFFRFDDSTPQL